MLILMQIFILSIKWDVGMPTIPLLVDLSGLVLPSLAAAKVGHGLPSARKSFLADVRNAKTPTTSGFGTRSHQET